MASMKKLHGTTEGKFKKRRKKMRISLCHKHNGWPLKAIIHESSNELLHA